MGAHMALTMAVPVLLVPGAPVTLAARAIRPRKDGSRGGREWILLAVHSKFASIIANPIVAAVLFAGSLWVFYYSPLFRWSMLDHIGHEWMIGALPDHRLPLRAVADRHRPGALPAAVPVPAPAPARHHGVPRVLRPRDHVGHRPAARRLVRRDGLGHRRARRPAARRRHRLVGRRDPHRRAGDHGGGAVGAQRREGVEATATATPTARATPSSRPTTRASPRSPSRTRSAAEPGERMPRRRALRHPAPRIRQLAHFSWIAMLPSGRMVAESASWNGRSSSRV